VNFQDAVIFLAAVIVIVSAGVVLGAVLKGRGQRQLDADAHLQGRKAELYAEIIGALDSVSESDDRRKQWFIHRYYQGLVYAPDSVVRALNRYLDVAADASSNQETVMELRARVVKQMRDDKILSRLDISVII
jgi:hypothetical protein